MKILKLAAFALGGIAALLAAAVLYVAITFDAVRVKEELRRVVLEQKQRTLDIEGDVDLSFYPNLGLKLGRTALSEHNSTERFAAIDSARVSVAVLPLLSGSLVVDEIRVEGASVALIRYKDGSFNFEDLLSAEKDDSSPVRFDIAGLKLSRSALAFRDEGSGAAHALDDIELSVGKLANAARGRLDLAARWTSVQPTADSRIVLATGYDYDLPAQRFALEALSATMDGTLFDLTDVRAALTSERLEAGADDRIEIRKLALDLSARRAGEALSAKLTAPALQLDAGGARGDEVSLTAKIDSSARMADIKLQLKGIEGSAQAIRIAGLTLALDARQDTATVKAALASPLNVQLDGPSGELSALDGTIDIAHPSLPMKSVKLPVKGSARADLKAQTAALDLDTRLDDSHIQLKLAATRLQPLALNFDVDIDQLDLDRYRPPAAAGPAAGNPDDTPVDLSALRGINASGSVRIGALQVAGVKMTKMTLNVKAANGKLEVSPYSAALYQGAASGALSLNAEGNRIALKQTLSDIDVHPLIRDAAGKDLLEGRGTVMLDVATSGTTVGALKRALDGSASLKLRDGAIRGINLAKSLREAKAKLGGGATVQQASATEKTDFSALSASFRIDDGIARNSDLTASSPFLRLAGAGTVNLPDESVDYLARVTLAATSKGQDGRAADELRGVTVPVRLYGPFASLDYKIEFADLVKGAARTAVEQQSQKLQDKARDKVQEQVGDKLKGLFGR
ncbi:AsmA family protein [Methyloversatilis sp.]|uniref:AsmA family protein n=1 Tax=Methyloversatilis sp. TaxID=2569862 RepID=UPI00273633FC|nr:AsmA family protein [Methyloversatilis sp.]MDP2869199.1 AsmA family protein [Methyloversatilis sp.]MDP3457226.1 AsmA family protein [Methyloversatilis sp.]MDP3576618.1 AsmA family protein [Methyloversatilis sp.]